MSRLDDVKEWPLSSGKRAYLKYLLPKKGVRFNRAEAMRAKCAECQNGYQDGRTDCFIRLCPLYPWMPYRADKAEDK